MTAAADSINTIGAIDTTGTISTIDTIDTMSRPIRRLLVIATTLFLVSCGEPESTPGPTETVSQAGSSSGLDMATKGLDFDHYLEVVEPIFMRYRGGFVGSDTSCVACHTVQANAPLGSAGDDPGRRQRVLDQCAILAELSENVAMLVNPSAPETSRLLLAPLAPAVGGERHSGGIFWDTTDHAEYRAIADWIAGGSSGCGRRAAGGSRFRFLPVLRAADLCQPTRERDALYRMSQWRICRPTT